MNRTLPAPPVHVFSPSDVAQVSKPAVSPISKSAESSPVLRLWRRRSVCGLETRDTAGLETCATARSPLHEPVGFIEVVDFATLRGSPRTDLRNHRAFSC